MTEATSRRSKNPEICYFKKLNYFIIVYLNIYTFILSIYDYIYILP